MHDAKTTIYRDTMYIAEVELSGMMQVHESKRGTSVEEEKV
jgi:hypothetical protein